MRFECGEKKKPIWPCVWLTAVSSYGRVGFINVNSSLSTGHIQSPVGQNVHQSLQWLTDGQTIVCFHSLPPSCDGFYKLMFLFIVEDLDLLTSVIARGEGGGGRFLVHLYPRSAGKCPIFGSFPFLHTVHDCLWQNVCDVFFSFPFRFGFEEIFLTPPPRPPTISPPPVGDLLLTGRG